MGYYHLDFFLFGNGAKYGPQAISKLDRFSPRFFDQTFCRILTRNMTKFKNSKQKSSLDMQKKN
jgi:hypothetical protein